MLKQIIAALASTLALSTSAGAATLFSDNFDGEVPGLNAVPSQWSIVDGTVDIIGSGPNGSLFDLLPGHGYYLDLDGSTNNAALMSHGPLALNAGTVYTLSFLLAGSQRGDTNSMTYGMDWNGDNVLDLFASVALPSEAPFTSFTLPFIAPITTTSARIIFNHAGGDNLGLLLDNVALSTPVPEPETYAMLVAGFGLLGFIARRRKRRAGGA